MKPLFRFRWCGKVYLKACSLLLVLQVAHTWCDHLTERLKARVQNAQHPNTQAPRGLSQYIKYVQSQCKLF